nr:cupin domain-containing protein [Microtetraspora sp. NBRC 13810]
MIFPGGVGVSGLRVYDWPTADGLSGGTPHLHLACAEAYVVVAGSGAVQTLAPSGYAENPLEAGDVVWFPPGTIHRLLNFDGGLRITVIMQNGGLPEAGDAVFTFPPEVMADPEAYARAAVAADPAAARARRDLAIDGFLRLRRHGAQALADFLVAAHRLIAPRLDDFEKRWRAGALAAAGETGEHLERLRRGDLSHLAQARVRKAEPEDRLGMCGRLQVYPLLPAP